MKLLISVTEVGVGQSRTALIFSGLHRMPSWDTMCPRKDTCSWNKTHFFGLSFKFADFNLSKTEVRFSSVSSNVDPKVMISSRYTRHRSHCNPESMASISRSNVAGLLERPNGKTLN